MTRRRLVLFSLVAVAAASAEDSSVSLDLFEPLASALSAGDVESFMKRFDRQAPNLGKLRENVAGLVARFDITSSIELIRSAGNQAELDWYLELRDKQQSAAVNERRRQTVTVRVEKKRIVSIEPIDFFAATTGSK